jgi:hypothetical protein
MTDLNRGFSTVTGIFSRYAENLSEAVYQTSAQKIPRELCGPAVSIFRRQG